MKPGTKLKSQVCDTEVMVIRAGAGTIECGGVAMAQGKPDTLGALNAENANGALIGKRYVDATNSFELLCVKPGKGSLSVDGVALGIKDAKPLPASD
jgi:riboflavin synthase alpha subunit